MLFNLYLMYLILYLAPLFNLNVDICKKKKFFSQIINFKRGKKKKIC